MQIGFLGWETQARVDVQRYARLLASKPKPPPTGSVGEMPNQLQSEPLSQFSV